MIKIGGGRDWRVWGKAVSWASFCFCFALSSSGRALDPVALAKKVQPSVLLILEKDPSGKVVVTGSGFLVSSDGKLVTNDHGRKGAEELWARAGDGRVFRVEAILARDRNRDRELLQLAANGLPHLSILSSVSVQDGEEVAIVPSRFAGNEGIILGQASVEAELASKGLLLAAFPSAPNLYMGAPVIGSRGQVLGVATAGSSRGSAAGKWIRVAAIGKLSVALAAAPSGREDAQPQRPSLGSRGTFRHAADLSPVGQEPQRSAPIAAGRGNDDEEAAWGHLRHREYARAAAAFEQALRRNPDDARIWLGFGLAKRALGQTEEASVIYRHAVQVDPSSERAWRELGEVDLRLGRCQEAADAFGEAVRLRPSDEWAWVNAAAANLALKKREEALADLEQVQGLPSADGTVWYWVGKIYLRLGKREKAAKAWQRAVDRNPEDPKAWLGLGLVSIELGRTDRALEILPRLLELNQQMGMKLLEALRSR